MLKAQIANHARISGVNFSPVGQNIRTFAGLPFQSAVIYASVFFFAFWFYSVTWVKAPIMASDSTTYIAAARDFSDFHIDQPQSRAPGYPLFLVLTGSSQFPNRTLFSVSLLLHFASIWLLASVLWRAGLREVILILFAVILLLPPYVEPAAYVLTENLTEAMLVAGFVSFVFWILNGGITWLFISALTIGYAALTRPTYQLLAFAMASYVLVANLLFHSALKWKDVVKLTLILACGTIVIVGGYAFVNYRSFGYFGVSPVLGLALTQKTVHVLERLPDEYSAVRETLIKARNSAFIDGDEHTGYSYIDGTVPELTKITGLEKTQLSNYLLRLNLLLIQKAPLQYLQEVVWSFGSYWFPSSTELANFNSRSLQFLWAVIHFLLIAGFAFSLVLLVGGVVYVKTCPGLRQLGDRLAVEEMRSIQVEGFIYGLAGTMVFYSAVLTCLIQVGLPRYRVPTDGLIIFMFFLGTHLWRRLVNLSRTVFILPKDIG